MNKTVLKKPAGASPSFNHTGSIDSLDDIYSSAIALDW